MTGEAPLSSEDAPRLMRSKHTGFVHAYDKKVCELDGCLPVESTDSGRNAP